VGIGLDPWARLCLESWFKDYSVASRDSFDVEDLGLNISFYNPGIGERSKILETQQLIASEWFQDSIDAKSLYFSERPLNLNVLKNNNLRFACNDIKFKSHFENKAKIREITEDLPFIPSETVSFSNLTDNASTFKEYSIKYGAFVVQEEMTSGGRGTYFIHSPQDFSRLKKTLMNLTNKPKKLVVAKFVHGKDVSIQGCITKGGLIVSTVQGQIIGDPILAHTMHGAEQFSGIIANIELEETVKREIHRVTEKLAGVLSEEGYRGVFGVDFMIDDDDRVYFLEANTRMTGASLLLTMLQINSGFVPFSLLNVLEIAQEDYDIEGYSETLDTSSGSMLMLHNTEDKSIKISDQLKSGTYTISGGVASRVCDSPYLDSGSNFILHLYANPGQTIAPGKRIARIYTNKILYGSEGLTDEAISLVGSLKLLVNC